MHHYKKGKNVEEELSKENIPIENLPKDFLWMHVKGGTKIENVIEYAKNAFKSNEYRTVVWSGSGGGVTKTISCAEIMKRDFPVHQITKLGYQKNEEYWVPTMKGLEEIVATRYIPAIHILLTLDVIDRKTPGYQFSEVGTHFWIELPESPPPDNQHRKNRKVRQMKDYNRPKPLKDLPITSDNISTKSNLPNESDSVAKSYPPPLRSRNLPLRRKSWTKADTSYDANTTINEKQHPTSAPPNHVRRKVTRHNSLSYDNNNKDRTNESISGQIESTPDKSSVIDTKYTSTPRTKQNANWSRTQRKVDFKLDLKQNNQNDDEPLQSNSTLSPRSTPIDIPKSKSRYIPRRHPNNSFENTSIASDAIVSPITPTSPNLSNTDSTKSFNNSMNNSGPSTSGFTYNKFKKNSPSNVRRVTFDSDGEHRS